MSKSDNPPDMAAQIFARAEDEGINPAIIAREYGLPIDKSPKWWCEPVGLSDADDATGDGLDLIGDDDNALVRYILSMCRSIQFPPNTAYLHGLGVVASAMTHNHTYSYHGDDKPVTLYVVTAQPPSSGKSAVNGKLTGPIRAAVKEMNQARKERRAQLEVKIAELQKEMKKGASKDSDGAMVKRGRDAEELVQLEDELSACQPYGYGYTDATPEALERDCAKQDGVFTIVSDEADAINVILGAVYGGDKKANYGIFLSGWDGDYFKSARITRDGHDGHVRGSVAVIAQDDSIDSIISAGATGRGISERFWMIREPSLLGRRRFDKYVPIDETAAAKYAETVGRIFSASPTTFYLSEGAHAILMEAKQDVEPTMGSGGEYSNNFMQGVVGKADKQIMKMASVLHALKEYSERETARREIPDETVAEAALLFRQCLHTYRAAADARGHIGSESEAAKIIDHLQRRVEKKKYRLTVRQLRDAIKNTSPFSRQPDLTKHLKNNLLPTLQDMGYVVFDKNTGDIFINPRMG